MNSLVNLLLSFNLRSFFSEKRMDFFCLTINRKTSGNSLGGLCTISLLSATLSFFYRQIKSHSHISIEQYGHSEVVKTLLKSGAEIDSIGNFAISNEESKYGTPLHLGTFNALNQFVTNSLS